MPSGRVRELLLHRRHAACDSRLVPWLGEAEIAVTRRLAHFRGHDVFGSSHSANHHGRYFF